LRPGVPQSQGIYSKGDVTVTNASVNALNAKAAVLKGNNTITLSGTTLEGKETTDTVPYNIVLFSDEKDIGTCGRDEDTAPVSNHDGRRTVTCGRNGGVFHFHHGTGGNSGAGGMISRSNNGRILQADIGALAVTVIACRL